MPEVAEKAVCPLAVLWLVIGMIRPQWCESADCYRERLLCNVLPRACICMWRVYVYVACMWVTLILPVFLHPQTTPPFVIAMPLQRDLQRDAAWLLVPRGQLVTVRCPLSGRHLQQQPPRQLLLTRVLPAVSRGRVRCDGWPHDRDLLWTVWQPRGVLLPRWLWSVATGHPVRAWQVESQCPC